MKSEIIKVLLIDDDEDDYILTRELFSLVNAGNYVLDWASSYEEGLRIAQRGEHHVCLVDYYLGERSGVELIREAREARLATPMILLTGQGDHDVDVEAMEAGATDFLVKAETSPSRLERTVRYAVQLNAERCRAEERLGTHALRHATIAEIGRLALIGGDLKELFAEVVTLVAKTLPVEYCEVLELPLDSDALTMRASVGCEEEFSVGQDTVSGDKESQADFTLLSDKAVVVEDLRTETRFSGSVLREHGVLSGMTVIIRGRMRPYGVLGAHTTSVRRFASDDVNFLLAVANVLAEAIGRKAAEDEIRQSEARYRRVVESNMLGILSWNLSGEITGANEVFLNMVGYTREDLAGGRMRWPEMTPPHYRKLDEKALRELVASGVCEAYEKEYLRKDGSPVPILLGCAMLEGENQRGVGFVLDLTARKKAEDQLRHARDFSENLIQTANVIILGLDMEGKIGIFNQAAEQITGYTAAELQGTSWFDHLVPKDRFPCVREEFNRLLDGGIPRTFESPIITKSGEERYIMWQNNQVRVDGEVVATISFGNDITEHRRAEAQLHFKTSLLESQTEASIDGILVVSDDARILSFNSRFVELWNIPESLLATESDESAFQSLLERLDKPLEFLGRVDYLHNHPQEESDNEIQLKDGRTFEGHSAPIKSEEGEYFGRVWFFHDVTERKAAEQALRQSESQSRALFENAHDAVLIADNQGAYVDANPAACALLGVSYNEIIGRTISDFTEQDQSAEAQPAWAKFLKEGKMRGFFRLRRPDREVVEVDFSATANFLPGRHFSMLRDVTERRKLEQQLRQSQKLESVGMLAGGIAHDFNNLLTVITGYSELALKRLEHADPVARNIEEVKRAAEKAASLTRQLLAFSRKQVLQPKVLDLNIVIADIRKMLGRLVGEDMELRTSPGLELGSVKADPGQIEQVILNLVVNARDAMPQGGKIILETANVYLDEEYARQHIAIQPGWYVMLAVSDTGHGMDAETQKYIFEPFFTTKEQGKGTGLGLSTVYGIIKQSGGNIWVYSEVGVGTSFKIYLPLVDEQATEPNACAVRPASAPGTETILVAEDEEMVRTMVRESLKPCGYTVLEAASGGEALLISKEHEGPIHLLLTDVVMPKMSGKELADQLVKLRPDTRVLYMSGYTDQAIVHYGILDGDIAFIGKPFTPDALVLKVVEALQLQPTAVP